MGLKFQPQVSSVLMCNFKGLIVPEIVKIRPIIVIARNRYNNKLVTVVPVSTTEPIPALDHHYELRENPIPGKEHLRCWVKCDMIMAVSIERLDRIKLRTCNSRNYEVPWISDNEMKEIKNSVLHGIGMSYLVKWLDIQATLKDTFLWTLMGLVRLPNNRKLGAGNGNDKPTAPMN